MLINKKTLETKFLRTKNLIQFTVHQGSTSYDWGLVTSSVKFEHKNTSAISITITSKKWTANCTNKKYIWPAIKATHKLYTSVLALPAGVRNGTWQQKCSAPLHTGSRCNCYINLKIFHLCVLDICVLISTTVLHFCISCFYGAGGGGKVSK